MDKSRAFAWPRIDTARNVVIVVAAVLLSLVASAAFVGSPARQQAVRPTFAASGLHTTGGPNQAYMSVDATKQGKLKGTSNRDRWKDQTTVLAFSYSVSAPRDLATGQTSGKRQHAPFVLTIENGASAPQLFSAATTNEVLTRVVISTVETSADGAEIVREVFTLTSAVVAKWEYVRDTSGPDTVRITLIFRKIEIEDKVGKTMAVDDWSK
jgi:type VI secretion system secreted protein Hcp